jgi:CubicO group peptidase (beta-lactamase class C family)
MTGIAAAGAAELDAALNRFVTQGGLPGAAAGVVHGDELSWAAGAGFADTSAQVTSDPGTLYRIASITKTSPVRPSCSYVMRRGWTWMIPQ